MPQRTVPTSPTLCPLSLSITYKRGRRGGKFGTASDALKAVLGRMEQMRVRKIRLASFQKTAGKWIPRGELIQKAETLWLEGREKAGAEEVRVAELTCRRVLSWESDGDVISAASQAVGDIAQIPYPAPSFFPFPPFPPLSLAVPCISPHINTSCSTPFLRLRAQATVVNCFSHNCFGARSHQQEIGNGIRPLIHA